MKADFTFVPGPAREVFVALMLWLVAAPAVAGPLVPADRDVATAVDRRQLEAYTAARAAFDAAATAYWTAISDKRRLRTAKRRDHQPILPDDYVLTQPPVYAGPPKPVDPSAPAAATPLRPQVPTANFFLQASYARNPVAIRNNVVAALIAATDATMDREVKLQGARDLAAAYPR